MYDMIAIIHFVCFNVHVGNHHRGIKIEFGGPHWTHGLTIAHCSCNRNTIPSTCLLWVEFIHVLSTLDASILTSQKNINDNKSSFVPLSLHMLQNIGFNCIHRQK